MENETVITVKNIGKKYNIAHQQGGYVSLRDVLTNVLKNPFAFLKQKAKKVVGIAKNEEFWALKNINFEVKKGEVIGIIGRNGAGKSTLLKILSQITPPTEGEIKINGRVGSLLEVGTGFHPELSGRENIFLNGAILGMTKKEISKKFDAIVAFSGIEKFLDTPVKRYSSGMYVRLAFSVAAHMDPDILIIDEVLAVGDAEFQKKCIGKMDEITKKEGRTILFVSHNMGAIQQLCNKTIWIDEGKIKSVGETEKIIDDYIKGNTTQKIVELKDVKERKGNGKIKLSSISFKNKKGENTSSFVSGEECQFWLEFENIDKDVKDFTFNLAIDSVVDQMRITTMGNKFTNQKIPTEKKVIGIIINKLPLNVGEYYITLFVENSGEIYDWIQKAAIFSVKYGDFYGNNGQPLPQSLGQVLFDYKII